MGKNFYTKGGDDVASMRIGQVHTITMYCPLGDIGVQILKNAFDIVLQSYKTNEHLWSGVPAVDALNAFVFAKTFSDGESLGIDYKFVEIIISSLKMFTRLKKINFEFTDDQDIEETYTNLLKKTKKKIKKYIYRVEMVEINLADMFSQNIIDLFNKVLIANEIIPNSCLERKFKIDFKYDDYITFIKMFITNNEQAFNSLDKNICEYFGSFPKLVTEQKPNVRVITNYMDFCYI